MKIVRYTQFLEYEPKSFGLMPFLTSLKRPLTMFCNKFNGSGYLKMLLYIISQNELELRMDLHLCSPITTSFKKFEAKVRVSILSQFSPYSLVALLLIVSSCLFIMFFLYIFLEYLTIRYSSQNGDTSNKAIKITICRPNPRSFPKDAR